MSARICISKISNACVPVYVSVRVYDFICTVRSQPKINIYISLHHNLGSTNFHAIPPPYETGKGTRAATTTKIESAFRLESIFQRLYVRRQAHVYQRPDVESIGWLFSQCAFDSPVYKQKCTYFTCDFLFYQSKPHTQISRRTQTHTRTHTFTKEGNRSDRLHLSDFRFTHKKWIRIEMVFVFFPVSFSLDSHEYASQKNDFSHSLYQQHRTRQRVYVKYAVVESFPFPISICLPFHFPSYLVLLSGIARYSNEVSPLFLNARVAQPTETG